MNRSPMFLLCHDNYAAAGAVTIEARDRWIGRDTAGVELFNRKDYAGACQAAKLAGLRFVSSAWYGITTDSRDTRTAPVRVLEQEAERR